MSQPDWSKQSRQPDMKSSGNAMPSGGKPPLLPFARFHSRKAPYFIPLAITAICAAGLAVLLARGMLVPARAGGARETKSEPGLSYTNARVASEPWSIHV